MKSELEVFKKKREALTSACGSEKETKDDLDENISPELRQAIIKMRKLDKILDKKVKKEKEVKRDRIILQRKYGQIVLPFNRAQIILRKHYINIDICSYMAKDLCYSKRLPCMRCHTVLKKSDMY